MGVRGGTSAARESAFLPEALEANRSGRLSDDQGRRSRAVSRRARWWELGVGAMAVFLGIAFSLPGRTTGYIQPGSGSPPVALKPFLAVGCLVVGGILLWLAVTGRDVLNGDVRSGRVRSIEGAIRKTKMEARDLNSAGGSGQYLYTLWVDGQAFTVPSAWESDWAAAPAAGHVRLFYLPRSRIAVNLERLPDPPVSEVTRDTLVDPGKAYASAMVSPSVSRRNRIRKAEAAAHMAAVQRKFAEQLTPAPPPADQCDPRPLAQALVGSWTDGLLSFAFLPDGRMTFGGPRRRRSGHWRIAADGRLHASVAAPQTDGAREWVADAWVAGDELTIVGKGVGWKLRRMPP